MSSKELDKALIDLCQAFNKEGVRYVVIGGFAVIMHGLARLTEDIDFFVDDSPENIMRLKKALSSIYHDPSIEELKPDEIRQYAVIRYGTPDDFYIDFIGRIGEVFSFKDIERDMEIFEIDNIKIPVCGLETLIKMKETMRERDMRDLIFRNEKRLDDFTPCYPWHCSYPF
jgi:predicted nucleotidyltransferase